MAPRKQASKTEATKQPPPAGSKEAAEDELRRLVEQAREATPSRYLLDQAGVYARAVTLLTLLAVSSNVSALALSPVYGGIPAAALHGSVVAASLFAGWSVNLALRRALAPYGIATASLLALVAAYVPAAQRQLFALSGALGATYGPAVTESLTLAPLLVLGTACAADALEGADLAGLRAVAPGFLADSAPGLGAWFVYQFAELESAKHIATTAGRSLAQTRVGFETVLAALYAVLGRSKLLLWAVPALLHTAFMNTHLPTPQATASLNATLNAEGWSLVDRQESLTGYMSVLDNHKEGYRVLRCDHSLLGGEWTKFKRVIVAEPIYSVFTQLEAVRLVQAPNRVPDNEAKALNV